MQPVLLIDFGSTYTKVTAVDVNQAVLLGTAASYTTVATDINDGLNHAMKELEAKIGSLQYAKRLACSSAAGGLRMITSGLVPELTAEAARLASLGAGAKVIKVYSYQLTEEDVEEIDSLRPDIFLLTGGTDGGNSATILHNARMLSQTHNQFPIIIAGNRSCAAACERILEGKETYRCVNVMPKLGVLDITPVQEKIREIFLRQIIQAKGLSQAKELISGIMMPTPSAMLRAMELLAGGTKNVKGIGELIAVDLGGATTDFYSIASGSPSQERTILKGLPEPYAKRTVEGDIGMRYSALGILEAAGLDRVVQLSGLSQDKTIELTEFIFGQTDALPDTRELASLDFALACAAIETAARRHAGKVEEVYTAMGVAYMQTGKDLTRVDQLIVTGGAIVHNNRASEIARHALMRPEVPDSLLPKKARVLIDRTYILAAMGLLSETHPDVALTIMKKELEDHGTQE